MLSRKNILYILIIISVCAILFLLGLGNRGLWSPDETRYVAVSKEILDSGDWINLRRNSEIYAQKPPVFFWLISALSLICGKLSEFSSRLPSALAGLGGAVITYLFANRLFNDRKTALFSSLILVTSMAYMAACRWVILDPVFTFFVVLAMYLLYSGLIQQKARGASYILASAAMALATLTKGPIGFILPLLTIGIYAFSKKESRSFFTKELAFGFLLFIIIVLGWLIPACVRGGEGYTRELLLNQIFGRFFNAFDHKEPFYFYFLRFPLEFMPWTVFLLPAAVYLMKNKRMEPQVRLLFTWFSVIFLFFTFSKSKNDLYILPAYPAAAMAVAYYRESCAGKKTRTLIYVVSVIIALNTALTYVALPVFDKFKSPKYFSKETIRHVKPQDELVTFDMNPVYWLYYCNRRQMRQIDNYDELEAYLKSPSRVFCIIASDKYEEFTRSRKGIADILVQPMPYGRKSLVLISNK